MAIKDVDTKCYILALFIRNDGARFLLGSGAYEFKEGQQHFAANTMQNDVVEVQGNDGYLLAGQVRRPGVQSFDGYVGDSSTSKPMVEGLRRDFFQFFRKGYFYKVVYVFPDGSAIQRKRGFLVDAPVVQELYQIYPEYHVALNFEDINYYFYDENDAGQEIYGKSAIVGLSMATGGLVWDNDGAVTDPLVFGGVVTVKGVEKINNLLNVAVPLASVGLYGGTYQQTYSGKNLVYNQATDKSQNGVDMTMNQDGTVTANGPGTGIAFFLLQTQQQSRAFAPGTYTIKCQTDLTVGNFIIEGYAPSDLSTRIIDVRMEPGTSTATFTLTDPDTRLRLSVVVLNATKAPHTFNNEVVGPFQLEVGSTATSFEPYVGGIPSPNPDYPQEVQTVTGEQTVTVTGDGGASQSYTISLGSTELCKIGDYQDYIYKSGVDWYVHKETGKQIVNVSTITLRSNYSNVEYGVFNKPNDYGGYGGFGYNYPIVSTHAIFKNNPPNWNMASNAGGGYTGAATTACWIGFAKGTGLDNIKSALSGLTNYYALATPTDTQITDTTLIGQLNALGAGKLYAGENNLMVTTSGTNLPAELEVGYYTEIEDGYGFVWEEGRSPSNIIAVDSIDDVFPVLTITGETENPILTNVTTGTIFQYNGTITASQTLVIDMMNQTATLNGTSVIGNVTGDWVYFAPGNNRVSYTAGNANAPDATIEWQEIVG